MLPSWDLNISKVVYRIVRILRSKSRKNCLLRRCLVGKDEQSIDSPCGGNGMNMCSSFLAPKYCREVFETNKMIFRKYFEIMNFWMIFEGKWSILKNKQTFEILFDIFWIFLFIKRRLWCYTVLCSLINLSCRWSPAN